MCVPHVRMNTTTLYSIILVNNGLNRNAKNKN